MKEWSNLARIVYARTYSRNDTGTQENWDQTIERVIAGNVRGHDVSEDEIKKLLYLGKERKAVPAGRGLWFSGSPAQDVIGMGAAVNCWAVELSDWQNFVLTQNLLMWGGGVGASVEARFVSKLPKVKKDVVITHKPTKDADFIVPDSREGWCELTRQVLESYFSTGRSFSYSTYCLRGYGEKLKLFGGTSSGPLPLIRFVENISNILNQRQGKHVRPVDASDITTATGELVVSGNIRRSAILILGDCWDKEYLSMKRWDLGQIPSHRSCANYSVVCDDIDDLHPSYWKTFENGEAFGIVNRKSIQKYGRMGDIKKDNAYLVNPCVTGDTEVLTSGGYKPIDQLVGRTAVIWNGRDWSEVKPRITGSNKEIFRVEFSGGQSLKCTDNHEFVLAIGYKGKTKRVQLKDLQIGDKLAKFSYPVLPDISFAEHKEAYTQGFISAEGMDDYNHYYVYGDKQKCIPRMLIRHARKTETGDRTAVYPSFEKLSKSFVPLNWDYDWKLEWLAGLLDGDGTVLKEGGIQVASVNKKFLQNVQKMLTTLGTASKVCPERKEGYRDLPDGNGCKKSYFCQELYRLIVGSTEMEFLQELGLKCSRLQIKGFTPQRNAGRFLVVTSIESEGVVDKVYCFTEPKNHTACFEGIITGQCSEICLEHGEACNLQEIALPNLTGVEEFEDSARIMHRYGKRVTMMENKNPVIRNVVERNRRIGTGITGCLSSPLFEPKTLDRVYEAIQDENRKYSKELGIAESIRTTTIKPSGTVSKVLDLDGYEGIHAAYSRYIIQRIRFGSNDPVVAGLRLAGHPIAPVQKMDGTLDHSTLVVDFYVEAPKGFPVADEGFDTWKQLEVLKMAQKHWSDNSISVSIYYKREEIPSIKEWLANNIKEIKTISFLCHTGHGFVQAPKEPITKEQYEEFSSKIKPLAMDEISEGEVDMQECGGACPVK